VSDPFIGEVKMFAGNFAPRGWAFCNGQILSIAQNTALFSLLGTNYGGNGQTTFALPNLQGRVPAHFDGNNLGDIGAEGGTETVTITAAQFPAHAHRFPVNDGGGEIDDLQGTEKIGVPASGAHEAYSQGARGLHGVRVVPGGVGACFRGLRCGEHCALCSRGAGANDLLGLAHEQDTHPRS